MGLEDRGAKVLTRDNPGAPLLVSLMGRFVIRQPDPTPPLLNALDKQIHLRYLDPRCLYMASSRIDFTSFFAKIHRDPIIPGDGVFDTILF